jgi:hypothetical protein
MNDYNEFRKTIAWIFAMFPGVSISASQSEAWWSLFDAYPSDLVRDSARLMISERAETNFPPTAIELMRYVKAGAAGHAARRTERPERTALPEPSAETLLGPDHPVSIAVAQAGNDPRRLIMAILASLDGPPVAHNSAIGANTP